MSLTSIEYKPKELGNIILQNFVKLMKRRNYIDNEDKIIKSIMKDKEFIDSNVPIKIDSDISSSKYYFYISTNKLNSISQNSPVDEFLSSNVNNKKFVIITEITKKVYKQIIDNYPNSEIFSYDEMLEDIPSKLIIPNHILLNDEDKKEFTQNFELKNLKKINQFDMMSRYFGAKPNDVFRIERSNITSGKGIDYRVVIPGKLDFIFN